MHTYLSFFTVRCTAVFIFLFSLSNLRAQQTWSLANSPSGDRVVGVAHDGKRFGAVAANNNHGAALSSTDGINWSEHPINIGGGDYKDIAHGNGVWVVVGQRAGNLVILSSPDLITWTDRTPTTPLSSIPGPLFNVSWLDNQFVAVGGTTATAIIATSPDGITWSGKNPFAAVSLKGVASNGSRLVAAGNNGIVLYSDDGGTAWNALPSITADNLEEVIYGNGLFVAVGSNGRVMTSTDGLRWITQTSGVTDPLFSVEAISSPGAHFVASGSNGRIIESTDGFTWTTRSTPTAQILHGITYGDIVGGLGRYVSVGSIGEIIHSEALGDTNSNPIVRGDIVSPPAIWPAIQTSGNLQVVVISGPGTWSLTSDVSWVTFSGGSSGDASATVTINLAGNTGNSSRQGIITLTSVSGTQTFHIHQNASLPAAPHIVPGSSTIIGTTITAEWDPVSTAASYRVERSVDGNAGPWQTVATFPASQSDYTESGLMPVTRYHYRVYAINGVGESPASQVWGGETGPAGINNLTANPLSHFEIELTWSHAAGATSYYLERREAGATTWDWNTPLDASLTTFTSSNLLPDTVYEFQITSVRQTTGGIHEGPPSNIISARTAIHNTTFYFNDPQEHVSLLDRREWLDVFDNGNTAIAVGSAGLIARNTGGDDWPHVGGEIRQHLNQVVFGNSIWLASGWSADLFRSTDDGVTWQPVANIAAQNGFSSLIFAQGQFIGLNADGSLLTSTDGLIWTTLPVTVPTSSPSELAEFLNYDPDRNLYAISRTDGAVFTAPAIGGIWTLRLAAQGVAFGSSIRGYVVGSVGHLLVRASGGWAFSSDGINWTESTYATDPVIYNVGYHNGLFYGITANFTLRTTSDGATWSAPQATPLPFTYNLFGVGDNWWAHGFNAQSSGGQLARGSDLNSLTVVSTPGNGFDLTLNAIAFDGADTLVAVGEEGQIVLGSISSRTWTSIPPGNRQPLSLFDVTWDGTRWIAVGAERVVLSSLDGTSWTVEAHLEAGAPPFPPAFTSILATTGGYLAASAGKIYSSTDLINWIEVHADINGSWVDLISFDGKQMAFGLNTNDLVMYSPDSTTWNPAALLRPRFRPFTNIIAAEAGTFGGNPLLLTVSQDNSIYLSRDGTVFTLLPDQTTPITGLSASPAGFLGFRGRGSENKLSASLAGITWQDAPEDLFSYNLAVYKDSVAVGNRHYLVGGFGVINSLELSQSPPNSDPGTLNFSTASLNITEGANDQLHTLELVRTGGTVGNASVTIQVTAGSTATPGADFDAISQTVTWADGQGGIRTINLNLLTDDLPEGDETILLELSSPSGATLGTTTQLTINVADQPLQAWQASRFANPLASSAQPTADFDNDGILNYIEFLLGLDPTGNDSVECHQLLVPTLTPRSKQLALSLTVAVDPRISVSAEVSSTLQSTDWSTSEVETSRGPISGGQRNITFTDTNPLRSSPRFLRLVFDYQP